MYRSRAEKNTYLRHLAATKNDDCPFCSIPKSQVIKQTRYFNVIRNVFPYSYWDWCRVKDHLMIVPRKHVEAVGGLPDAAKIEFVKLIDGYERRGYDIYARTPGSTVKSVPHQHTHCIRTDNRRVRFLLMLTSPYRRWLR